MADPLPNRCQNYLKEHIKHTHVSTNGASAANLAGKHSFSVSGLVHTIDGK